MARLTSDMRVYVDANAVIRATEGRDEAASLVRQVLRCGEVKSAVVATSVITISETLVGPLKELKRKPESVDAQRLTMIYAGMIESHTAIETVALEIGVLFNAAKLRADHASLKLPDAVHLASAQWCRADALVSGDLRLLAVAKTYLAPCSLETADLYALLATIDATDTRP